MVSTLVAAGIVFVVFFVATLMIMYGYARYKGGSGGGGSGTTTTGRQSKGARTEDR